MFGRMQCLHPAHQNGLQSSFVMTMEPGPVMSVLMMGSRLRVTACGAGAHNGTMPGHNRLSSSLTSVSAQMSHSLLFSQPVSAWKCFISPHCDPLNILAQTLNTRHSSVITCYKCYMLLVSTPDIGLFKQIPNQIVNTMLMKSCRRYSHSIK